MGHRSAAILAAATATNGLISASTSLTTSVYGWGSFAASVATVAGLLWTFWISARARSRRLHGAPVKPHNGASLEEWEEWGIRMDQWIKDNAEEDNAS